jgi:hypothetical protein
MTAGSGDMAASPTSPARVPLVRRHHDQFFVVLGVVFATLLFVIAVGLLGLVAFRSALH